MQRNVLEVETPILSSATASDPWLASIEVAANPGGYLQTSPEFPMKRLLASGLGSIFQICKCFREGEVSGRHNPEFTMLEWYRPGMSLEMLMQEIADLVSEILGLNGFSRLSYKQAFQDHLHIHPFKVSDSELAALVEKHTSYRGDPLDRIASLDLLLTTCIEPELGKDGLCFLTDYPAEQASLAVIAKDEEGNNVAKRAELYYQGIELANAYDELVDYQEQQQRFSEDNRIRAELGLPSVKIDQHLIAALEHGMPRCSGVALGVDRLLMLQLGAQSIAEVLAFPADRA